MIVLPRRRTTLDPPVFTETFPGANGALWDSSRWPSHATASSTRDIQNNQGRLRVLDSANAYARGIAIMSAMADMRVDFSVPLFPGNVSGTWVYRFYVRASGDWSGNIIRPATGYCATLRPDGTIVMEKADVNGFTTLSGTSDTFNPLVAQECALQIIGSAIKFKTWPNGTVEPSTWTAERTNADVTGTGDICRAPLSRY